MSKKRKDNKGRLLRTGESQRKDLIYLMGHSDAGVTLNVYAHASYQHAADQMVQIKDFQAERAARIAADMWAAS